MRKGLAAVALLAGLAACTVATQKLDEKTGTTLAERCADYRLTLAAYEAVAATRQLSAPEAAAYTVASAFVTGKCPPVAVPAPAGE